jgi:multidrug resistance protein, MATE family
LGIIGTGYAGIISRITIYIVLLIYTYLTPDLKPAIIWPDKRTFTGIFKYLELGIPSTLMLCLDWWAWELMVLISGYFAKEE